MLFLEILLTVSVSLVLGNNVSITGKHFSKVLTCPTHTESMVVMVSSSLKCASACTQDSSCRSFSVETTMPGSCYLHTDSLVDTGCQDGEKHFIKVELPCLNGGIYTAANDACRCFHGYVGNRCERLMQDCSEGFTSGHYNHMEALFNVHPNTSPNPFTMWCHMILGGRTYVMKKKITDPYVDFNQTWEEYKKGFGNMDSGTNFWLGNERLRYVTSNRPMTLVLQIHTYEGASPWNYRQRLYTSFSVGTEASGFNCSYEISYPNNFENGIHVLDDCMAPQKMMSFTSVDMDNDMANNENCAETHLSGWWYSDCGGCNPTGKLQPMSELKQNSDPFYISLPVEGNWAPRSVSMFLAQESATE